MINDPKRARARGFAPGGFRLGILAAALVTAFVAGPARPAGAGELSGPKPGAEPALHVAVDVRPGLCPNHLNLESPLTLPVAVLGTMDLEVRDIDPGTVRLTRDGSSVECEPVTWRYADVGMPVVGSAPDCNNPHGDGLDDLVMEFPIRDLVTALDLAGKAGESIPLILRGKILTGREIEGFDNVVVLEGAPEDVRRDEVGFVGDALPGTDAGEVRFAYFVDRGDRILFAVYDCRGRMVKRLVDTDMGPGIYRVTWSGIAEDGQAVPDGTYFARIGNGTVGSTMKFTLRR
jgi:hypothetical protein